MWSATQMPHILRFLLAATTGVPESKIRVIAPDVGGGFGGKLQTTPEEWITFAVARRLGKPVQVHRDPLASSLMAAHHGRDQWQTADPARPTRTARSPGSRSTCSPTSGAYIALVGGGVPVLGAFMFNAIYKFPAYQFNVPDGLHQQDLDRRLPRRRPARGDVRHRAADGRARRRARASTRSRSASELDQARGVPVHHGRRAGVRLRQLRGRHREGQGDVRVRRAARRAEAAPRVAATRSSSGIGVSTFTEMCGLAPSPGARHARLRRRRLGARAASGCCRPARSRWSPARPPTARATRRRSARSSPTGSGVPFEDVEVLHGDTQVAPQGPGHLRLALAGGRRRGAGQGRRQGDREGQADRGPPAGGVRGRPGVRRRPVHGQGHRPGHGDPGDRHARRSRRTTCPTGMEPTLDAEATYDPVNFSFPHGTHLCAMEVDTETGAVKMRKYVCRRRHRQRSSTR